MVEEKPLTLNDYAVIMETSNRFQACKIAEDLMRDDYMKALIAFGYTPPTRYDRFKAYWKDKWQRCKNIWTILSGGDIHEDCGY